MNQYQKRKCLKGGQHHNRDIEALCLQECCRNDRLLCFYCIHKKHENHQIIYLLEGLDSPIQKININSQLSDKQYHKKYLQKKIKKINHGWKNLYRLFESYIHKIQTNLQPQIAVIQQSFDHNSAKKFAQIITNVNTSQQTIDKYVQKIKLIMKYDLSDIDKVKVSTAVAYEELKEMYKSANQQIQSIMSKIVEETNIFSALDFDFSSLVKRDRSKLGIDVQNRISISITNDKTTIDSYQNRYEGKIITKKVQNRWEQKRNTYETFIGENKKKKNLKNITVKEEQKSQEQQNFQQQNKNKLGKQQKSKDCLHQGKDYLHQSKSFSKQKYVESAPQIEKGQNLNNEVQQNCQFQIVEQNVQKFSIFKQNQYQNSSKIQQDQIQYQQNQDQYQQIQQNRVQDKIIEEKVLQKNKFISEKLQIQQQIQNSNNFQLNENKNSQQFQQHYSSNESQSDIIRYRNFQYSESQHSISPPTIELKQIYLSFSTLKQIQHYLNKIPPSSYTSVQSLQISCDTLPLAVNTQIIDKIIQFTELKKLVICQSYGLGTYSLEKIVTNLPQLEQLVLQQNYSLNQTMALLIKKKLTKLKKFHYTTDPLQNLFFKQQNSQFLSQVDGTTKFNAIQILTSIPTLETISFQNIYKVNQTKKILQKMKKISQLSIIFHQKEYKVNYVIEALSQLPSAKSIVHLQLKQCYFREESLIQLIKNCNTLKSLVLNKCRDVTNNVIQALKKHKNYLKQLDFMEQDQITGVEFQHFVQLQILSLKACWQIEEDVLGSNIIKLTKLKCLNLNFNRYWVTQKIFGYISKLQNLESLSIDNNKVNFNCLLKIKDLSNLTTMACGNTELQGEDIIKFLQCTKSQIKKLSLKRQIYEDKSTKNQINNRPFLGNLLTQISRLVPLLSHLNIKGMRNVQKNNFQNLYNLKCLSTDTGQLNQETIKLLKNREVSLYIGYNHHNYQNQNSLQQKELRSKIQQLIKLER